MSEKEFYVNHTETGLVYAEDEDEAFEKAVNGESETGWNTLDLEVEELLEVEEVTEEDFECGSEGAEITVEFESGILPETSEIVEDLIKEALNESKKVSNRANLRSSVTGNEVSINVEEVSE